MTSQAAKRPRTEMNGDVSNALGNEDDYNDVSLKSILLVQWKRLYQQPE